MHDILKTYTQHRTLFDSSSITRKITRSCLFAFVGLIQLPMWLFIFLHIHICYLNEANTEIVNTDMIHQSGNGCMSSIESVVCLLSERKTVLVWGFPGLLCI